MEKQRYHRLLEKIIGAVVHYRILIGHNGRPRGLIFLDLNPAFVRMAGIDKDAFASGSIMTETPAELIPFGFDWLGIHALLAKPDSPLRLEHYSEAFKRRYKVTACRDEEGYFAALFRDVPPHKEIENRQSKPDINDYKLAEKKILEYSQKVERLYCQLEGEMEEVSRIHRRTFPVRIPQIKGCSLAAHYQPAKRLGGDFYDIIETRHKLVLYLSDVSGHGPEGVLLSAFTKEAINSYISLKPDEIQPEKILLHGGIIGQSDDLANL